MKGKEFFLTLLSQYPALAFSAVGGIIVPVLDNFVGSRTRDYLNFFVTTFEPTRLLFHLSLFIPSFSILVSPSLFHLFALWHILKFLPPMARYIRGLESDMRLFESLALVELQLFVYLGPTMILLLVRALWSVRGVLIMVLTSLADLYATCPDDIRSQVASILLPSVGKLIILHNRYDLNIRGLFMHVCESVIAPFDRFEIAVGRWRRSQLYGLGRQEKTYEHRKLKDNRNIRLLRLKRRDFFSRPSCELIEVSLDAAPPFEAISYTWGLKAPSIPIDVDGNPMLVTATVDELLWYRRSIFASHLFWIDAICINQKDQDEKSSQLAQMIEIYRRAARVVVWLGAPESRIDTRVVRKMIRALVWPETVCSTAALLPSLFSDEKEAFIAIGKLFSHPWYERIWIVQEVAAGKIVHVMYHGICIEWETLVSAAHRLGHDTELKRKLHHYNSPSVTTANPSDPDIGRDTPVNIVEEIRWAHLEFLDNIRRSIQIKKTVPLPYILTTTIPCKATDPRDKIYAVLGISQHGQKIKTDYKDELQKVFVNATVFALSTSEWFLLLSIYGRGYESWKGNKRSKLMDNLPSWVPDYTADAIAGSRPGTTEGILSRDPAGKVTFFVDDSKIIQLQVSVFDKIEYMGPKAKLHNSSTYLPNPNVPKETFAAQIGQWEKVRKDGIASWYYKARQLARQELCSNIRSQEAIDQDFWELCMSQHEYIDAMGKLPLLYAPLSRDARKLFESCFDVEQGGLHRETPLLRGPLVPQMIMYLARRFTWSTSGKGFCITAAGNMALVPPLAKEDDILVHVRGGYIPIALRQMRSGVRKAELIGACFVQNVHDVYFGFRWENWLLE